MNNTNNQNISNQNNEFDVVEIIKSILSDAQLESLRIEVMDSLDEAHKILTGKDEPKDAPKSESKANTTAEAESAQRTIEIQKTMITKLQREVDDLRTELRKVNTAYADRVKAHAEDVEWLKLLVISAILDNDVTTSHIREDAGKYNLQLNSSLGGTPFVRIQRRTK